MRHNKIGTLFLVSVLALAGIGISYAGFSDSLSVYGTVDTATVVIDEFGWYSGTWVWKVWGDEYTGKEIYIFDGWVEDKPTDAEVLDIFDNQGATDVELVSYSYATDGGTHGDPAVDYDIDLIYYNLFPCIDFEADFIFHYGGSIPAKLYLEPIFLTEDKYDDTDVGFLTWLWQYHIDNPDSGYGAWLEAYRAYPIYDTSNPDLITGWTIAYDEPVGIGYQLHACNYVYVNLVIHLPQDNELQGLTGSFGAKIGVIQWNDECETPPG